MSEEIETEAAPKRGGKKIILAVVLVVGALAGGGAGAFFAGPLLAEMILGPADAAAAEAHAPAEAEEDHGSSDDHGGGHGAGAANYLVENLVLNPAQSNGTRFLMASVSLDLKEAAGAEALKARDAQVRDALLTVLGHKTVEQLTDIAARDSIKSELKTAVSAMFPEGTIRGIYLPQFVIQ
jgi:flagellar protein FliL